MEALKDPFLFALGDADAVIGDSHHGATALAGHGDREARRADRVSQAVVDQIVQDATELVSIHLNRNRVGRKAHGDFSVKQLGLRLGSVAGILGSFPEVRQPLIAWQRVRVDARGFEVIRDNPNQDPIIAICYMGDYNNIVSSGTARYVTWGDNRNAVATTHGVENQPDVFLEAY